MENFLERQADRSGDTAVPSNEHAPKIDTIGANMLQFGWTTQMQPPLHLLIHIYMPCIHVVDLYNAFYIYSTHISMWQQQHKTKKIDKTQIDSMSEYVNSLIRYRFFFSWFVRYALQISSHALTINQFLITIFWLLLLYTLYSIQLAVKLPANSLEKGFLRLCFSPPFRFADANDKCMCECTQLLRYWKLIK